jgi:hypothetical protein
MSNITPIYYPILDMVKNDDWSREIIVWADDAKTVPFVFTNWAGIMQVKKRSYGNPVIVEFKTSDGTMVLSTGLITLIRDKALTDIEAKEYRYDIEFKDATAKNRTLFKTSPFSIISEISDGTTL